MNSRGSTAIQNFIFPKTKRPVRCFFDEQGNPWWVATDVCRELGYENSRQAIIRHCKPEGVSKRYTLTRGGNQELTVINEANLYRLIMRSHASNAEPFQDWVCEEVLPSIRKTGAYDHLSYKEFDPTDPIQIRKLLDVLTAQALKDQEAIKALKW